MSLGFKKLKNDVKFSMPQNIRYRVSKNFLTIMENKSF